MPAQIKCRQGANPAAMTMHSSSVWCRTAQETMCCLTQHMLPACLSKKAVFQWWSPCKRVPETAARGSHLCKGAVAAVNISVCLWTVVRLRHALLTLLPQLPIIMVACGVLKIRSVTNHPHGLATA